MNLHHTILPAHDRKGLARIEHAVMRWLHRRMLDRLLHRFGGIQQCPWCKQCAQLGDSWRFDSNTDPTIDALHCGVCGGVSRWRFEMGMMPLTPIGLSPPWPLVGASAIVNPGAQALPPKTHFMCEACGSGPWHVNWDPDSHPIFRTKSGARGPRICPDCSGAD